MERNKTPGFAESVFALALSLTAATFARTITVNNNGPADYPTIQAAIDDANDGDVVLVAPGTCTDDGNRDIRVYAKAITIKSERGPQSCIINCGGNPSQRRQGFVLFGDDAKSPTRTLEGFTITGAYGAVEGGGIYCYGGSPRIVNCIIVGNNARMGGGIACRDCSEVVIANCVISGNMAPSPDMAAKGISGTGGGVLIRASPATLTNCLITGNRTTGTGGALACGPITIVNCTISGNSAPTFGGIFGSGLLTMRNSIVCENANIDIGSPQPQYARDPSIYCRIAYSLVGIASSSCKPKGVECPPLDQLFARADYWDPNGTPDDLTDDFWVQGDYHLKSQAGRWDPVSRSWVKDDVTSPAIDAGDPASPLGVEPFPNSGRINLGVYGGTPEASKSYFGEPICETMIPGDINGDCRVDFADWAIMASHWLKDTHPAPTPPPPALPKR